MNRQGFLRSGVPRDAVTTSEDPPATRKFLLQLVDGAAVECVLIPMRARQGRHDLTLCLSTQVGCAMGCTFCASGLEGLRRSLTPEEILAQVDQAGSNLRTSERLRNYVFMGMGEPLHHYERTRAVLHALLARGISPRRITVSTVGLVEGIRRLGEDFGGRIGLALSLHAARDASRSRLVPVNARHPIGELVAALQRYPLPARRRILVAYTLMDGLNDSREEAEELARLLLPLRHRLKLNLLPWNVVPGSPHRASPAARVHAFRELLAAHRFSVFVRAPRGETEAAACGQLALRR